MTTTLPWSDERTRVTEAYARELYGPLLTPARRAAADRYLHCQTWGIDYGGAALPPAWVEADLTAAKAAPPKKPRRRPPHDPNDLACNCASCGRSRGGQRSARLHLNTPEQRAASAERMRARWADQVWRAAQVAARSGPRPGSVRAKCRAFASTPEQRALRAERLRRQRQDPVFDAAMRAALAAPETRAKVAATHPRQRYRRRLDLGLTETEYAEYKRLQRKLRLPSPELVAIVLRSRKSAKHEQAR
jgi:hypothetical protein